MNTIRYNGKTYTDQRIVTQNPYTVTGDDLISASAAVSDSIVADRLEADTLTATVVDHSAETQLLAAGGVLVAAGGTLLIARQAEQGIDETWLYAAPVVFAHNGVTVGEFYLDEITRVQRNQYKLTALSAAGILISSYFYGGLYTGETCGAVVAEIVADIVPYSIDPDVAAVPVYGWIPKGTRRDALKAVLFAVGGQVSKDVAGQLCIIPSGSAEPYAISVDDLYIGGSVTGGKPATGVQVTEHAYMELDTVQRATLFDGYAAASQLVTPKGVSVEGVLVEFNGGPYFDLEAENAQILESGVNYAVLSSSASAVLTGVPYTHTTRIVSRTAQARPGQAQNVVSCSNCYLVNPFNSERVADRLMAYYGAARTVTVDLVLTDQRPGDAVTFTNPFGEADSGFIRSLDVAVSGILKARAQIITGYAPVPSGNNYTTSTLITSSGQWTAPKDGVCLVYVISGGTGGAMGSPGESGGAGSDNSMGSYGDGGEPGEGGSGGRVAVYTVQVKAGQVFAVSIGPGGAGQTSASEAASGGDTTFGPYSSAGGFPSAGVTNPATGAVYGLSGPPGIAGARGGGTGEGAEPYYGSPGPPLEYLGQTYQPGANGEDYPTGVQLRAYGGFGGGSAAGANGGDGGDANNFAITGGHGGSGATPVKPPAATVPGQGGQGGHGGGGGGGGGANTRNDNGTGVGGSGGAPGPAGDGAPGAVLILM